MSPLNIVTTIAMFPLLLPLWEQRPITSDDIYPTPYPIEVQNADVRSAAEGFRYGDYAFRQRLVQNLAETHNRLAAETLLTQLQIEPNEDIKATILGQIRLLPYNANAALQAVTPLLDSPDRTVRQWAVTLYGELDDASGDVLLQKTLNDPDPQVRRRAAEALPVHAQSLTASELQKLRKSPDAVLRAWGWAAMCHVKDARQIVSQLLAACRAEPPNVRHAIANHMSTLSPSVTQDLYDALSQDNHPSVRGQTAAAIGRAPAPAFLPLVLRLADDPDYEVRRQAVHSLVAYPEPAAGEKIVAKYGDPSVFVRREAESSATELHPQFDMADLSVARISDSDPNVRYRAYNVLGSIDARQHGEAVGNALLQERDPRLISASLLALSRLRNIQFTEQALRLARHADANVRKNAVLVLGNATGPRVREAVLRAVSDPDTNVREASLLAMGRIAHPSFAPTLLTVLRSTSAGSDYSSKHRNIACWASGKLPSMPEDLAERLVRQATTPVIPVMGMMMFEPDYVLVSACWALAEGTRRDAALTPFAEKVITMQSRDTTNSAGMGSPNELSPSAEVREYARQAQAYMDGKPVQAHRRPTRDVHLIYSKID